MHVFMEVFVRSNRIITVFVALLAMLIWSQAKAQLKIGYVNSQKILDTYKEAQDAKKKLAEINKAWEQEALNMQREIQELQDKLEKQALVLTEKTKAERTQEIQNLAIQFQQFQQQKWGPQGQIYEEEKKLMQPVIDKINAVINQVGETDNYDYIFDVVAGNILYASKSQTDLTERVIEELKKAAGAVGKAN